MDHLPEIFLDPDGEPVSEVRWHYMDCITHMFTDAFARQIGDWCEDNDLMLTGHVLAEPTLDSQTRVVGSAMRFYEHMQAPGVDMLTEHRAEYGTVKQCSSVQHQLGRRWVLSETYGCTGWDFPFEGHKAVGDWQAALGVNLRCQHLSWYTMAGQAKRDYPASIHFQSPWWTAYDHVEDYFARVNTLMSKGEACRSVLVIHPVESVWALAGENWEDHDAVQELDEKHQTLRQWLLETHIDFDYADEAMLDSWGEVIPDNDNPKVRLCQAVYGTVVVPPTVTVRRTTLELLEQFASEGGNVIFCGDPPTHIDAVPGEEKIVEVVRKCADVAFNREDLVNVVDKASEVSIQNAGGDEHRDVLYQLRQHNGRRYLFICNTNREEETGPLSVQVEEGGDTPVEYWNAETGRRYKVRAQNDGNTVCFDTELATAGSKLFVLGNSGDDLAFVPHYEREKRVEMQSDGWTIQRDEPNVLVLDYVQFELDGGNVQGPVEVLKADQMIRDELGLEQRGGRMVQPWNRETAQSGRKAEVSLSFEFRVDAVPETPLMLALEQPDRYEIKVNGQAISRDVECGWWVDPAIRTVPLDQACVETGANTITLMGTYDSATDIESLFVLGDFSVNLEGRYPVIEESRAPGFGDWTKQGLPFYAGSVAYRRCVHLDGAGAADRVCVEIPDWRGACVRLLVDGQEAGVMGWEPYEMDITEFVENKDEVELVVQVISHRRNAFGPLHNTETWPHWTGAAQFVSTGDQWQDEYNLVPCGCFRPPVIRYDSRKNRD